MKIVFSAFLLLAAASLTAQDAKNPTLKSILLEQLRTTHNVKDWFVPVNVAVAGITPEQANWTDGKGNHSVAQLASHLLFWNMRSLAKFKGEAGAQYNGNNDETFSAYTAEGWEKLKHQLDSVLTAWEQAVEAADETKLKQWYSTIAHIGTHNAYHTGEMVVIRKEQGSWDPEKGVK